MAVERERGCVWLLEDSALEGELARRSLATLFDVEVFTEGSSVLERLGNGDLPDALVLDWQLPTVTGLDVCRFLRDHAEWANIPVLMLTVYGHKQAIVDALEAGANDYVIKPFDVAELVARVSTLVRSSRLHQAQARRTQQLMLVAECGAALTKARDVADVSTHVLSAILDHTGSSFAGLVLHEGAGLGQRHWVGQDVASLAPLDPGFATELLDRVVQERGRIHVVTEAASGARRHVSLFPLLSQEDLIGVLVVGGARSVGTDIVETLAHVADLSTLAIARLRADADRGRSLDRERLARAEAEDANRSKDEFLAVLSHELRTPLNAILGWATMLIQGAVDASRVEHALKTIERNARSQAQLMEDLLDVSRIISGKLKLERVYVDLAWVVDMARESVRPAAETKRVRIDLRVDGGPFAVSGDAQRLQQVIWNLMTNAIKFSAPGGTLFVTLCRTGSDVELIVRDEGVGIAKEFLPHVFERYRQAEGASVRSSGGLGLGLAIVRHLVGLHGGNVAAESPGKGKGATFTLRLPASHEPERRRAQDPECAAPATSGASLRGVDVVVAEDDDDSRDLVVRVLEQCGAEVRAAANAAQALALIEERTPLVLVSDVAMPGEDGLSLIRRVRVLEQQRGVKVTAIALTAFARAEDKHAALEAGFQRHVAKPLEVNELIATMVSLLDAR